MRTKIGCVVLLAGMTGIAMEAAAEEENNATMAGKRGLSPIIIAGRTLGICQPIENKQESRLSAVNGMSPVGDAMTYLEKLENRKFANYETAFYAGKITLLQAPIHGELKLGQNSGAYYSNDYSYEGPDSATVLVEVGGYQVKVIYHFVLMHDVPGSGDEGTATDQKDICPKGEMWKISTTPNADGNITVSSVEYLPADPSTSNTTLTSDSLDAWLSLAQLDGKIADMSMRNRGQTTFSANIMPP
jgi:hypothetical protein